MTDISFLTESVTEVDRCCKEIVGIDLPECCLGAEFNLLTSAAYEGVLDVAGASRVTAPRALAVLALSHIPKKPHTPADPPPADPANELAPARRPPRRRPPRWRGSAGAQEPEPAASPPGRGQRRSPRARQWQINLVVLDERCAVVCRTRTAMQFPAEFYLQAGAGQPDKLMTWIGHG